MDFKKYWDILLGLSSVAALAYHALNHVVPLQEFNAPIQGYFNSYISIDAIDDKSP